MKEPLMRIGKSQMRVPSNRSSEMRLHLNRVGTQAIVAAIRFSRQTGVRSPFTIDVEHQTPYALG